MPNSVPHERLGVVAGRAVVNGDSRAAIAAVLGASMLWGTTGAAASLAPQVGPLAIGALAMGMGGLLQALIAAGAIAQQRRQLCAHKRLLALGALAVFVYPLAFYASMHWAGVAIGTVVSLGVAPLASALIERVFEGLRLSRRWAFSVALGMAGLVLIGLAEQAAAPAAASAHTVYGVLLGALAGLSYALYAWAARQLMHKGIAPRAAMGSIFGVGGLLLLPVLLVTGAALLQSWENAAVGLYMALVPMFLGYVLFGFGLSRLRASTATTLTLTEPVVAAGLAVWWLGERLTALGWVGMALMAGCLLVLSLPAKRTAT